MRNVLIKNGKINTMEKESYDNADILIIDGKIKAVGQNLQERGVEIIDARGLEVYPGFIDAHCHLGLINSGMRSEGDDVNEITDPVTPSLRAIDGINPQCESFEKAREGGITTVMSGPGSANVVGGQFATIKTSGTRIDDMIIMEPSAMKIAFGENPKRCYGSKNKSPESRMATAAILRKTLFEAKEYYEKKKINDKVEFDMDKEAFIPVFEKKIPLKAHAHRADDILTAMRIAKEFDLRLTLDHCTEGHLIAKHIKEEGLCAIVGPTMTFPTKIELRNKTFDTPKILFEAGVKIAIMTDHPVIEQQYLPICVAYAVKAGLPREEGLKAITINAAEIMGIDNRVGSIKAGKDGDIVIFDGDPLALETNVVYTIIDGEVVYKK